MIELYHAGLTACSKKVRLCLREKGIEYVSRFININAFEQHDPAYLALNPNGVVPTLVHDGFVIYESTIINEYIDEAFPEIPLVPQCPKQRARVRLWGKRSDEALAPNLIYAFAIKGGIGESAGRLDDQELALKIDRIPLQERRDAVRKVAGGGFSSYERDAARLKAEHIVQQVEDGLKHSHFLVGDHYSLADINMLPFIQRFKERVIPDRFTTETYPLSSAWLSRLMSRPKVIETFVSSEETSRQGPA